MLDLLKNKKLLCVVAHPDDELLGLGATINLLVKNYNCEAKAVILGEGLTSRTENRDVDRWKNSLEKHHKNIDDAAKHIGYSDVSTYNLPDNRFDSVPLLDIVKIVESEKEKYQPDVIFTHHSGDTNIDHRKTFDAVIAATRPMKDECVKTIISFETPSSTEWQAFNYQSYFKPNAFVKVTKDNLSAKIKGMEAYEFEKRDYPHPRSSKALEILAQRWGVVVGTEYAEAFSIIRSIG